jgi:hypothetical protein
MPVCAALTASRVAQMEVNLSMPRNTPFTLCLHYVLNQTHPHPNPPLEGEGIVRVPPLEGEGIVRVPPLKGEGIVRVPPLEGEGIVRATPFKAREYHGG